MTWSGDLQAPAAAAGPTPSSCGGKPIATTVVLVKEVSPFDEVRVKPITIGELPWERGE